MRIKIDADDKLPTYRLQGTSFHCSRKGAHKATQNQSNCK